jgi:tyrosyl-tRNA synthetase
VDELGAAVARGGPEANRAKRAMARAVVTLYHGAAAAAAAEERFDAVFSRREIPTDVPEYALPEGDPVHLPALLVAAGLARGTSAARRDIDAGAVRIDGTAVAAGKYDVDRSAVVGAVLTSGKRKAVRVLGAS